MANPLLAKYDLDKFAWRATEDGGRIRLLAGVEVTLSLFVKLMDGHQNLFAAVYVDLASPVGHAVLQARARDAWIWLRYHIPTIAAHLHDEDLTKPMLSYHTSTPAEIPQWAGRTFTFSTQDKVDLGALRVQLGPKQIPSQDTDLTWLHIVTGPVDASGDVRKFGVLLHTHHVIFDANASNVAINWYLQHLALILRETESDVKSLHWGEESENIPPSAYTIMSESELRPIPSDSPEIPSFAHPYYASLGRVMKAIAEFQKNLYGFKPRSADPGKLSPMRVEAVFTGEELMAIITSLKRKRPGKRYTVTHLAHSALAMAVMFFNPPSSEAASHTLNSWGLTDPRYLLREPYSRRYAYPAMMLVTPMLRVPVSCFLSETGEPLPLDKHTLLRTMDVVRELYADEKAKPTVMSWMAQAAELFSGGLVEAALANQLPPNQNFHFTSEGVVEDYLNRTFVDSSGKTVISVEKIFSSVNYREPGPFFHIWSWNDIIYLSADFNVNVLPVKEATSYMAK